LSVVTIRKAALASLLAVFAAAVTAVPLFATEPNGAVAAPEFRPDPGEPRRLPQSAFVKPDLVLRGTNAANAAANLSRALGELNLQSELLQARPWLAEALPSTIPLHFDGAIVMTAGPIPHGRVTRRAHIEIIPVNDGRDVAVKFWEACDPSLSPDVAVREWHPCGAPTSRAYRALVESIKEQIALADGGANR